MKKKLLDNIALDSVKYSPNGKNITFEFLNTYNGKVISLLTCENVFYFESQNGFEEYDGFAAFIHEIYVEKLPRIGILPRLKERKYAFMEPGTNNISLPDLDYMHIYFESNECIIDVFCQTYNLDMFQDS